MIWCSKVTGYVYFRSICGNNSRKVFCVNLKTFFGKLALSQLNVDRTHLKLYFILISFRISHISSAFVTLCNLNLETCSFNKGGLLSFSFCPQCFINTFCLLRFQIKYKIMCSSSFLWSQILISLGLCTLNVNLYRGLC